MIKTYSLKTDGLLQLSPSFRVREFRCRDGSDIILIDDRLPALLQQLRDYFGRPIHISSGFRTLAYNRKIGGHPSSRHLRGQAADIDTGSNSALVDPLIVCMKAQALGASGLGAYQYADGRSWAHIGCAQTGQFWRQSGPGQQVYIDTFLPTLRKSTDDSYSDFVIVLQQILTALGYYNGPVDGSFGRMTQTAVKAYQKITNLAADGVCGPLTWALIMNEDWRM